MLISMPSYDIQATASPQLTLHINTLNTLQPPSQSIIRLIIPIQRMTLDLWPRRPEHPIKRQFHILQQMARDLNMPHIRWMVQRANIIVLQNPRRVEVVHVPGVGEVVVHVLDLREEAGTLCVGVAYGGEAGPERL